MADQIQKDRRARIDWLLREVRYNIEAAIAQGDVPHDLNLSYSFLVPESRHPEAKDRLGRLDYCYRGEFRVALSPSPYCATPDDTTIQGFEP